MANNAHSPQVNLALQHEREGRESEALKVLEAAAAAGDSHAQLLLAQRLIWQPRTRPLALQLVQQSAQPFLLLLLRSLLDLFLVRHDAAQQLYQFIVTL